MFPSHAYKTPTFIKYFYILSKIFKKIQFFFTFFSIFEAKNLRWFCTNLLCRHENYKKKTRFIFFLFLFFLSKKRNYTVNLYRESEFFWRKKHDFFFKKNKLRALFLAVVKNPWSNIGRVRKFIFNFFRGQKSLFFGQKWPIFQLFSWNSSKKSPFLTLFFSKIVVFLYKCSV